MNACGVTEETFRIVIDVRVDGDEISGNARSVIGEPKPFLGWLGLIAALDRLLEPEIWFTHAQSDGSGR